MARTIDGSQRRLDLADAVWRLILRDGLTAASVRNVAVEAGLSTGSVRHFFTTQAELQVFAMQALSDRVRERVARARGVADPRTRVAAILEELLPLTDNGAAEFRIWVQFVVRAGFDERLAAVARASFDDVRRLIVDVLTDAREGGLTLPDLDVPAAALELNALIDGLTFDAIAAPQLMPPAQIRAVLNRALARLLTATPKETP
jgi:AcrR family transcriptional regulator